MSTAITRRGFLGGTMAAALMATRAYAEEADLPKIDLHVHLDKSTAEEVLKLSEEQGVKYGIVEHAGTKENVYPVVLSNDDELNARNATLEGKPCFKGVQAEYSDWASCFSKEALLKLDYVLTDAMTFPGPDGRRMKLWEKEAVIGSPEKFIDQYVDWHLKIIETQPIDIMANTSWLPAVMAVDYDHFWTEERVRKIAESAAKNQVAIEISSGFKLPNLRWLQIAKGAGVKFSFGSNGRYPNMGKIDYSLETAKALGLTRADIFVPGEGAKAVERRVK